MEDTKISNFVELYQALMPYEKKRSFIFRGQAADWPLLPKGWRTGFVDKDEQLFISWKRQAVALFGGRPQSDWDWLSIAQHHRLATRLLDWTLNPLIAAFFATGSSFSREQPEERDGYIYVVRFDSSALVDDQLWQAGPFATLSEAVRVVWPNRLAARMTAQTGLFTLHGDDTGIRLSKGMHGQDDRGRVTHTPKLDSLRRIIVAAEAKAKLRRELSFVGAHEMAIYPDLDGLSSYLNWGCESGTFLTQGVYYDPATA